MRLRRTTLSKAYTALQLCDNHVSVIIIKYKKIQINKTESPLKSVNIIINGDEADDLEKDEAFALEELNDFLFKFLFS